MKWSVIGLVVIGLVSAMCVAVLVSFLPGRQPESVEPEKTAFVEAVGSLEQGTVISAEHVTVRNVPKGHEPDGAFRDPGQVIGKVLISAMSKGQAFTRACFPAQGAGMELASRLPDGMRAVSMEINDSFGLRGLLYPGSIVDILVALRSADDGEAMSKTLLEEVSVLAIDSRTVSTPEAEDGDAEAESFRKMMVTVLVSVEQAQQLQLAVRHGTLSLALRNPTDTQENASKDPTHLGTLLGEKKPEPEIVVKTPEPEPVIEKAVVAIPEPEPELEPEPEPEPEPKPRWQVTVIQGQKTKDVEFEAPEK